MNLEAFQSLTEESKETLRNQLTPKLTKFIPHTPYAKQVAFMLLPGREAFYGGAAGGGKSDVLLMMALQHVDVPGYSAILFRKTFADLVKPGALIDRALSWLAPFMKTKEVRWNDKEKKLTFDLMKIYGYPGSSTIQFGYLESSRDKFNYQGGEYQFIGFDEVTHIDEASYKYLFSRLRRVKGMDIPLRVRAASNPPDNDSPDAGYWVYNRFVNPKTKEKNVIFIPASISDNPFIDAEEYYQALDVLDPVTKAQLKDGNWEIKRAGNMFKENWFRPIPRTSIPNSRRTVRYWDMASSEVDPKKKHQDPDFTAGIKMSEFMGNYYIEDIEHGRYSAKKSQDVQKLIAFTDGRNVKVREEQEPGSSGVTLIEMKTTSIFQGYDYEGIKSSGSKIERANPASAAAEKGQIFYVEGCRNIDKLIDELTRFPNVLHDDLTDAFSGAFNFLKLNVGSSVPQTVPGAERNYWEDMEGGISTTSMRSLFGESGGGGWHID